MTSHSSTAARAQALGQLAFLAIFVGLALFQPALADYLGKPVIDWVARWLVIPAGIISLVIAGSLRAGSRCRSGTPAREASRRSKANSFPEVPTLGSTFG